jgi:hypothetical protein
MAIREVRELVRWSATHLEPASEGEPREREQPQRAHRIADVPHGKPPAERQREAAGDGDRRNKHDRGCHGRDERAFDGTRTGRP